RRKVTTRIIQDEPDSGNGHRAGDGNGKLGGAMGISSSAARWSANHRKAAILGWLGFVVLAFMIGRAVAPNQIHGADQFSGEAGRAEHTLYQAALRPNDEHVLIQSKTLTTTDPEFGDAGDQVAAHLVYKS